MVEQQNVYIVIPAYNEEENIVSVAREWHDVVTQIGKNSKLVIVDDGSKDRTYEKLQKLQKELGQLIAVTKENSGHGATVLFAYNYALNQGADFVFQTDSDGQTIADEFWEFWQQRLYYDIQIGHRKGRQDGFSRVVVTKVLKLVLFMQFGVWATDANTPFRLMSAKSLAEVIQSVPSDHNLANIIITVLYTKENRSIRYLPITFRQRQGGMNSINIPKIFGIGFKAFKDFGSMKRDIKSA